MCFFILKSFFSTNNLLLYIFNALLIVSGIAINTGLGFAMALVPDNMVSSFVTEDIPLYCKVFACCIIVVALLGVYATYKKRIYAAVMYVLLLTSIIVLLLTLAYFLQTLDIQWVIDNCVASGFWSVGASIAVKMAYAKTMIRYGLKLAAKIIAGVCIFLIIMDLKAAKLVWDIYQQTKMIMSLFSLKSPWGNKPKGNVVVSYTSTSTSAKLKGKM